MKQFRFLSSLATVLILLASANAQTGPGQWGPVLSWPFEVTHASVLSNGKVLVWPPYVLGNNASLWDPSTGIFTNSSKPLYNVFCAGHSHLADGRLLVTGGDLGTIMYGYPGASIYDAAADSWTRIPDMYAARWYPTNTTLANGDVLVTSGQSDPYRGIVALPQVWQAATGTWQDLSSAQLILALYPRTFLAPNGKVFYAGDSPQSRYLDTSGTGTWTLVAKTIFAGIRDYGSAVQYGVGKILIVGGGAQPTATAEVIDLTAATPAWRQVGSMAFPRRQLNATLLPSGQVLVTGGSSASASTEKNGPVLPAELWDPNTETWTLLASQTGYRGYHSVALLLPDATVLVAGGDPKQATAQVFSPPYLSNGPRPTISSAPTSVNYGDNFFVATPDAPNINQVTWLRPGSVTHSFNQDQRFNNLGFAIVSTPNGLSVSAPSNPNLAPPGDYMMFILNAAGVPSVATFIRLNTATVVPPPMSLAPSSVNFQDTVLGQPSATRQVQVANNQTVPLTITQITKNGDFSETDTCGVPISAGGTCTITVTFTPTALGERTGTIAVSGSAGNNPQILNLAGDGILAANTSPTSDAFGGATVGNHVAKAVILFNNQSVPLNIAAINTTGDFAQTNNCASLLAAGKNCRILVTFTPAVTGSRNGLLTITDDANNSPQTVTLSGVGK